MSVKSCIPFIIIVCVFVCALGGGAAFFHHKKQRLIRAKNAAIEAAAKLSAAAKQGATPPHVRGDEGATVTLEEFGDFQCPPCGDLSGALQKLDQDYRIGLRTVFRQFPMGMHLHAMEAARAAEAAGLQGRFWEMHDLLYQNRFVWPQSSDVRVALIGLAKSLGLDLDRFQNDMLSPAVKERIAADQLRGRSLGVDRTPTLFINGKELPANALNPPGLHAAVDEALKVR